MPKKTVIHVGQRFGMLVVIDADVVVPESELTAHERARGCVKRRISVQCDCGNKSVMVAGNVLSGQNVSCGCYRSRLAGERVLSRARDLIGQTFGLLTARSLARNSSGRAYLCDCQCGKSVVIYASSLVSGLTKSCGCYRRSALDGRRFGLLVVQRMAGLNKNSKSLCVVACDCGKSKTVKASSLTSGRLISCGCAPRGAGHDPVTSLDVRNYRATDCARRRSLKAGAGGCFTATQVTVLYQAQRGRCASCRGKLGDSYHRDHVVPLSLGGSNDISNIQLLCEFCNLSKGARDPIVWAQERGRLL